MRSFRLLSATALLTLVSSAGARGVQDAKINWLSDRGRAFAEARRTGKPLWVLFR
ncbi:MAG: hypothetical protein HYY17_12535 [Planctomycetes bacterium]|nr:hypothetical protein [Planctomycetota bacterium]